MTDKRPAMRAMKYLQAHPWAIQPEWLETIADIAQRVHEPDFEAVLAKQGARLDRTEGVTIRDDVALITISGPIFRYANLFTALSGATSIETLATDLRAALDNSRVSRIVLAIDSPGGQTNGVQEFADMVFAARKEKPITAYVNELGASAAYFIAAAASEIVMAPMAAVGSIGVVATARVNKATDTIEIVSSQSPAKRPDVATLEGRSQMQAHVDALAGVFVEKVAEYRGVDVATVLSDFGQGGVLVGQAAVNAGMADRLGSLEEVIAGTTGKGAISMSTKAGSPEITRELIEKEHPTIAEAFRAEGETRARAAVEKQASEHAAAVAAARAEGAAAERARILEVEAQLLPGHEKLIAELKADGKTTGPEAAMAVLKAERATGAAGLQAMLTDGAKATVAPSRETAPAAAATADDAAPLEERCKAQWDSKPELRKEFGNDFEAFVAFERATEAGQVRYLRDKRQAG
jgi:ClpP class serine protease